MNWNNLIIIFLMSIAIFIVYSIASIKFLSRISISKWVVLVVSLVFLFIGLIIPAYSTNVILNYLPTAVFVFFFLWYADLSGLSKIGEPKKRAGGPVTTIKPKAKPNKLKYVSEKDMIREPKGKEKNRLFKKNK